MPHIFVPRGADRLDFALSPVIDNGAEATVLACVCDPWSTLPPFVVVPGAPHRAAYMWTTF